jgi:hypothetical protein
VSLGAAPVQIAYDAETTLIIHASRHDVAERAQVGKTTVELLDSGLLVRRRPDDTFAGYRLDCLATDLVEDRVVCEDGRVIGQDGSVDGTFAGPARVVGRDPLDAARWLGVVRVGRESALQRVGSEPVVVDSFVAPSVWVGHGGFLYGAQGEYVVRWTLTSLARDEDYLAELDVAVEAFQVREGRLFARGRWVGAHGGSSPPKEVVLPEVAGFHVLQSTDRIDLPWPRLRRARDPVELVAGSRRIRRTRWGWLADGVFATTSELWRPEAPENGWAAMDDDLDWFMRGDELVGLDFRHGALRVFRFDGTSAEPVGWLRSPVETRLLAEDVFVGPDGRWWATPLDMRHPPGSVMWASDGESWTQLGTFPERAFYGEAAGPDHLWTWAPPALWRWEPEAAEPFVLERVGVTAVLHTTRGLVTWDGETLRRDEEVLLVREGLVVSQILEDDCGRLWLTGDRVSVLEETLVTLDHPVLGHRRRWAYGAPTADGVLVSNLGFVLQVARTCR